MLAASRIKSFVVVFGYENGGFMALAYPYFFDVEEFPDVALVGITPEQQAKNTATFKRMIQIAHNRGKVQGGGIPRTIQAAVVSRQKIRKVEVKVQSTGRFESVQLKHIARGMYEAAVPVPAGINWVRLRYRHLTQFEDYQTVNIQIDPAEGLYHTNIPGDLIVFNFKLMYFVETLDSRGMAA